MDFRLPAVPTFVSPLATAELHGLTTTPVGDRYSIKCPSCQGNMWVFTGSFLCENNRCEFLTGDGFDLTLLINDGDHAAASEWIGATFGTPWICLGTEHQLIFESIRTRRRLVEFFRKRIAIENRTLADEHLMDMMESHGIERRVAGMTAFPVSQDDIPELVEILRLYNPRVSMDDDAHLVIPMFSKHHEIAALTVFSSKKRAKVVINLSLAKFSYAGLWLDTPMMSQHVVLQHTIKAMLKSTDFSQKNPDRLALAVNYDATAPYTGSPLRNSVIVTEPIIQGLATASAYHRGYPSAEFAFPSDALPVGRTWLQFAYDMLIHSFASDTPTALVLGALETMTLNEEEIYEVKRRAMEDNLPGLRELIEEFSQNPTIFDAGKYRIKQTPSGYTYETPDGWRTPLTNFTLSFQKNLTFQDSGAVFHQGTMHFSGNKYNFTAPPQDLQGLKQLNERILQGVVARSSTPSDTGLPFISPDKNLQHVATHLQKLVSSLPCEPGTPHLGWTYARDKFFTSSWLASGEGIQAAAPLHPDLARMRVFEDVPLPEASLSRKLPGDVCELISMITAAVVRAFLNYRLRPSVIRHDQNSARLVPALFKALGQTQPIRAPEKENGLTQFPTYTFFDTAHFKTNSRSPFFVLGGEGKVVQEVIGDEDLEFGTSALRLILQRTADRLLSTPEGDVENLFQRRPHILYTNELALEGYNWIAHVLEIPNWIKMPVPYAHLEKELAEKEPKDIPKMFFYEPVKERVHILKKALSGDVTSVGLELKTLVSDWEQSEDYFIIDHAHAAALLEHYYGRMISLPSISAVSGE